MEEFASELHTIADKSQLAAKLLDKHPAHGATQILIIWC